MKINTTRETLIKGIQTIQAGVSSKTGTIPILQNFLMETEDQGLKVVFTDLEMAIKHHINVDIKNEGSITIPIKKFMEIVQNLAEEADVNVSVDESNKIAINSGKSKFKISGTPKNDYPVIPDLDETNSFKIPAGLLSEMVNGTIFSASTEDDRHFLNGLLWKYEKNIFSLVATDGRRLAIASSDKVKIKKDFKVIVPSKILGELVKFIKSAGINVKAEITVGLSSNQIGFKIEKTVFISRLIEGNFPAYEQIIPKTKEMTVEINAEKLLAVTKRASICANERNGSVKYLFKKGVLCVSSESQNMNFEDEFDIDYTGKDFQINFNPRFVMDIFKTSGEKNIIMEFSTPATPALMRIEGSDAFVYIVMPLRTQ
ncbi:MAG: DNA polymerase III subunit beta [Elusimicrobia bacterium GWC2_51_8]|nr:MAG: DNA polymerase III subunit beta [Elusimicrobia bacterium GWA2_51_34]OGR60077.1 MAG: DNA polymerase III subunit beta [Elusimicrobia bacterium GWC2_51_8]OGR85138.1 MAG: DNA polymerase III subunit beta [Elusimicrobia bacterium GWF2_52_66]HAF94523.1 DNA polymerase III subunit beta [Elusimicrobiota bacterium]HCE97911.1 DNA polymerase III subunit beta [Elusimicrobiota bacterium]